MAAIVRLDEQVQSRARELRSIPETLVDLYARRWSRIALGATATGMGLSAFAVLAFWDFGFAEAAPRILFAAWPVALVAMLIAWLAARLSFLRRLPGPMPLGADPLQDLARLEQEQRPIEVGAAHAERLETASFALPLIGASITLPLTLHALTFPVLFHGESFDEMHRRLTSWMAVSAVVVGHAHIALVITCIVKMLRAKTRSFAEQRMDGWHALGAATIVAAVPGLLIIAIPPMLAAATGILFIPPMFLWARKARERERAEVRATTALVFD